MDLGKLLESCQLLPTQIKDRTSRIYDELLLRSPYLRQGNFEAIHTQDLELLLSCYDSEFFTGAIRQAVGDTPLRLRLSRRLSSAAGQATRRVVRPKQAPSRVEYEITVSTTLLFQNFADVSRPVTASGILCRDRLEALQRVFEHELVHLAEMLVWTESSCARTRFRSIANRFFGHTDYRHQLITQRERAWTTFGIRVGDRVQFRMHGKHYQGLINRITRRATVLVEDQRGVRYSDGKHYRKFYVPLSLLERVRS